MNDRFWFVVGLRVPGHAGANSVVATTVNIC
jgi:hypothetical protein